jgi:hypothetical protein
MRRTYLALAVPSSACIFLTAITLVFGSDDAPAVRASAATATLPATRPTPAAFTTDVAPLVSRYCYECHGDGNTSGDLALDALVRAGDVKPAKEAWVKVMRQLRTHTMPPPDAEQHPSADERERLVRALHRQVYDVDPARPDPGRVTIRRLNSVEYKNTIRDLLGVSFDPTADFPQDDTGYGFDNIADVLTLPPMLMEKYLAAADRIMDDAMPTERVERRERRVPATQAGASFDARARVRRDDDWVALSSTAEDAVSVAVRAPVAADYVVRVLAYSDAHAAATTAPATPTTAAARAPTTLATAATTASSSQPVVDGPIKLSLMVGDVVIRDVPVTADAKNPQWYEARVGVTPGPQAFRAAVRRLRGPVFDKFISGGRVGVEQPGVVLVKEIVVDGPVSRIVRRVPGDALGLAGDSASHGDNGAGAALNRNGDEAFAEIDVPADRQYVLRAQAFGEYAGKEPARMELLADGNSLGVFDVAAPPRLKRPATGKGAPQVIVRPVPQVYEVPVTLAKGRRRLAARFLNNERDASNPDPNFRDRNLFVQYLELADPATPAGPPGFAAPVRGLFDQATKVAKSSD